MRIDLVEITREPGASILEMPGTGLVEVTRDPGAKVLELLGVGLPGAKGDTPLVTKGMVFIEPDTTETVTLFHTADAITVASVAAMVLGDSGCSVTFSLFFGPDRNSGTEIITGGTTLVEDPSGNVITALDEPAIPADSWVWLAITNTTGFVGEFHVSLTH